MAILHSERGASKGPPSPSTSRIPPAGFSNGRAAGSVAKSPHPIWGPALSRRLVRSPSASRRHEKLEFWEAPSSALGWPTRDHSQRRLGARASRNAGEEGERLTAARL